MRNDHTFSRRAVIAGFAAVPTFSATTVVADADIALIALVRKLNAASQALDQAVIGSPTLVGSSEWPNASTTGVPAGVSLTNSGDINSSSNGQTIQAFNVNGSITVNHAGVTIRNCRCRSMFINAANCTVENCEVIGQNWNSGINILVGNGSIVRRCNISGMENGIWVEPLSNILIEENYIHDLSWPSADPHMDAIQPTGCTNLIIKHNNCDLNVATASSCISILDGVNNHIDNNRLSGGSYIIYFEGASTGCTVTNNLFLAHAFGYYNGKAANKQTYSGNIFG